MKSVLVVDDEAINISLLAQILKGIYKVKVAKDGEKALKIAAGTPAPDLILLDVMMPGIDGFEVCRRLKTDPGTANIPVVFVTGKNDAVEQAKGMALGAAGYLHKPVDAAAVTATLHELLD
jgi:CheY-like chemotaxis protein